MSPFFQLIDQATTLTTINMAHQLRWFSELAFFMLAVLMANGLGIPHSETENLRNGIVLIGLDDVAKDLSGYGVIPVLEKDIINLFDVNATLADKIVGDARKFGFSNNNDANKATSEGTSQSSRLLPLVTAPKKALLLFALHETFLKSNKGQSNCVVLSKDDLTNLLNASEGATPRHADSSS